MTYTILSWPSDNVETSENPLKRRNKRATADASIIAAPRDEE
jgi:hypothetical protein